MTSIEAVKSNWSNLHSTIRGGVWMLFSALFFAGLGISIRMSTREVHSFEIVFFRNFFNLMFMLPWLWKIGLSGLRTEVFGLHVTRASLGLISMFFWFTGVSMMPLAEATSLGFTAPLFATIGAALILRETVRLRRWAAVLIGFAGTLIILRPGTEVITLPAIYMIAGAVFVACSFIAVKMLTRTESPNTMVLMMVALITPVSLIPALFVWQWPSIETWMWLVMVGFSATGGHIFFNRAMATADASAILPFDYSRLLFVAVLAFIIFNEVPDIYTWIGGAIIFGSTIYIAQREAVAARPAVTGPSGGEMR